MSAISFGATGDSFIVRPEPGRSSERAELARLMADADVRFTNLETVIRRNEGFPAAQSGGTWASSSPNVLSTLADYGFNLFACATNHALDYSYGGMESTRRYLDEAGLAHAGTGMDLADAGAIRFIDTPGGRVALIAVTSTFHESWLAGEQRVDGPGRPGVNGLRYSETHLISAAQVGQLRKIAADCGINWTHDYRVKTGFALPDPVEVFRFGGHVFAQVELGQEGVLSIPHAGDLERIRKTVALAKEQAAAVLVSIHAHESEPGKIEKPAEFIRIFSRSCIESGADAVIGHGPHVLRGIEIHQGKPIFYSLGNFIFQPESVDWQPADFYEKHHIDPALTPPALYLARSDGGRRGLSNVAAVWRSIVATWKMNAGRLTECILHPISLGFGEPINSRGTPRLDPNGEALEEISRLSQELGSEFENRGNQLAWVATNSEISPKLACAHEGSGRSA